MPVLSLRFLSATVLASLAAVAFSANSPFIYQGHLTLSGVPATGVYDFEFSLYDDPTTGSRIGPPGCADDLAVKDGLFLVPLEFGAEAFDGTPRWLEIAVRDGASTESFTTLSPRTRLSRTPYAVHTLKADEATTAQYAAESGLALHALHADHATNADWAATADQATTATTALDAAALGGVPSSGFALSVHTHTGATIEDGTIDAADLTTNPASLAKVTGGTAHATAEGRIGLGTTTPTQSLDVRGSMAVEDIVYVGPPAEDGNPSQGVLYYSEENGLLTIGVNGPGVDQHMTISDDTSDETSGWQTFTARVSGYLNRIEVERLAITGVSPTATIRLLEGESSLPLAEGKLPPLLSGSAWQSIDISPPVSVSAGTTYVIVMITDSRCGWRHTSGAFDAYPDGDSSLGDSVDFAFRTWVTGLHPYLTIDQNGDVTLNANLVLNSEDAFKPEGEEWATFSDSRVKTNIATLSGALDRILQLRGVTWQWKDPAAVGVRDNGPVMGLVADEVEKVIPQWVSRGPDGLRRLEIIGFEGLFVEALKELRARHQEKLDNLKSRIDSLRTQNRKLRDLSEELSSRIDRLNSIEERLGRLEDGNERTN